MSLVTTIEVQYVEYTVFNDVSTLMNSKKRITARKKRGEDVRGSNANISAPSFSVWLSWWEKKSSLTFSSVPLFPARSLFLFLSFFFHFICFVCHVNNSLITKFSIRLLYNLFLRLILKYFFSLSLIFLCMYIFVLKSCKNQNLYLNNLCFKIRRERKASENETPWKSFIVFSKNEVRQWMCCILLLWSILRYAIFCISKRSFGRVLRQNVRELNIFRSSSYAARN